MMNSAGQNHHVATSSPGCRIVACVGDSQTESGYPAILERNLNRASTGKERWQVLNLGVGGVTAIPMNGSTKGSYANTPEFKRAIACEADIIVVYLGTNDANHLVWDENLFIQSLTDLIRSFQRSRSPCPDIHLVVPPPLYEHVNPADKLVAAQLLPFVINAKLPVIIPRMASQLGVGLIDAFSAFGGTAFTKPEAFLKDGLHLAQPGQSLFANLVADTILGKSVGGALQLPQSAQVPQHSARMQYPALLASAAQSVGGSLQLTPPSTRVQHIDSLKRDKGEVPPRYCDRHNDSKKRVKGEPMESQCETC
jgi:lysophospholipase L1-like esterase